MKESDKFSASNVFEGMISIRAVLRARDRGISCRPIERILYDRERAVSKRKELGYLRAVSGQYGFTLEEARPEEIDALTIGSTHGGIIAFCGPRDYPPLTRENIVPGGFYMMLEGIEDPYNFGYALRSAYAAGADGIILTPRNWMTAAGLVCRASAGASELFPMFISEAAEAAAMMRDAGYRVVCADIEQSVSVYDADLHRPVFLAVGGEKRGLTRAMLNAADIVVRLDYGRDFPAALSAASAASILAYEVLRQNRP